jgi:hypothetical protein
MRAQHSFEDDFLLVNSFSDIEHHLMQALSGLFFCIMASDALLHASLLYDLEKVLIFTEGKDDILEL